MPYKLQIVRTADFIRFGGNQKDVDVVETRRALARIAKACMDQGADCALLDVRDMSSTLTPKDFYDLALAFREMGFEKHHRLAILHRARAGERVEFFAMNPGERAELFAMFATDLGWNVQAFDNYEEVMAWFESTSPDGSAPVADV